MFVCFWSVVSSSRARRPPPFLRSLPPGRVPSVVVPWPPARCGVGCRLRWFWLGGRVAFLLVFCVLRAFFFAFFLLRVVFFRSFGSCFAVVFPLRLLSCLRWRWFVRSAGPGCSVGSLSACPGFPCRLGFALPSASRPRVPCSLRGCAASWGVRGSWVGQWLALAPRLLVCRLAPAVSPLAVCSSLCSRNFF